MSAFTLLRRVSLFADLSDDALVALGNCLDRRVFAKDMLFFQQGSPARSLYLIESGAVRIFALNEMGREITLEICSPGECFGESALLDGNFRSTNAVATARTVVFTLPREEFLRCLELHPPVSLRVIALLAHRLEHATAYAEHLAFLDVTGRVAAVLLELAERCGNSRKGGAIELRLTQYELASWVCASREMVNKVLHTLRDQGLLAIEAHAIVVLNSEGLQHKIAT